LEGLSAYTVLAFNGTVTVLSHGPDGSDRLQGIEKLQFADRTVEADRRQPAAQARAPGVHQRAAQRKPTRAAAVSREIAARIEGFSASIPCTRTKCAGYAHKSNCVHSATLRVIRASSPGWNTITGCLGQKTL
jgi:hypothetical protein